MVTIVATGEDSKEILRDKGIEPGKIKTGSRSRTNKTTVFRDASGEFEKEEEKVFIDEDNKEVPAGTPGSRRGIKTTVRSDPVNLLGGGSPSFEDRVFYDQQTGRQLTQFESLALQSTAGGQSTEQGDRFVKAPPLPEKKPFFTEKFYRDYPYLAAQKKAELEEAIQAPGFSVVRQGIKKAVFQDQVKKEVAFKVETASSEKGFQEGLKNYRALRKSELRRDRESFGNIESSNIFSKTVGAFSLGAKTLGGATESLLYEQEQKVRFRQRELIGKAESDFYAVSVIKGGSREAAASTLKVSRNLIGGAVTDLGNSPIQAAVFASSFVLGASIAAVRSTAIPEKVFSAASNNVLTRTAVKGVGKGLRYVGFGAITYSTVQALRSPDPLASTSRLAGQFLSYSSAFKVGGAAGSLGAQSVKTAAESIKISLLQQKLKGKVLTVAGSRAIEKLQSKGVSVEVSASPVKEVQAATLQRGRVVSSKGFITKKGYSRLIDPSKSGSDYVLIGGQRIRFYGNYPGVSNYPYTSGSLVKTSRAISAKEVFIVGDKGSYLFSSKEFNRFFGGKTVTTVQDSKAVVKFGQRSPDESLTLFRGTKISGLKNYPQTGFKFRYVDQLPAPFKRAAPPPGTNLKDLTVVSTPSKVSIFNPDTGDFFIVESVTKGRGLNSIFAKTSPPVKNPVTSSPVIGKGEVVAEGGAGLFTVLKTESLAKSKTVFKPLSAYQGGDASFNPEKEQVAPRSFTREFFASDKINYADSKIGTRAGSQAGSGIRETSSGLIGGTPITAEAPAVSIDSISAQGSRIGSGSGSRSIVSEASAVDSAIGSADLVDTFSGSRTTPATTASPFTPVTPKTPVISRRAPPPEKTPLFAPVKFNKDKNDLFTQGFDVEARIGGVFQKISRSPLSLKEAIGFGSSIVGSSPAATFRVLKSSQPATGRFFGKSQIGDFERRAGGIFVEKREKRINTLGELTGITRKGQLALQARKVF